MRLGLRLLLILFTPVATLFFLFFSPILIISAQAALPDTGQNKCFQTVLPYSEIPCDNTGQDGDYIINPMSFTNNGDGTVTDNNTGLIWQRCSVGQTQIIQNNILTCGGTAALYNWYQATGEYSEYYNNSSNRINVCGSLNLGGGGWRLPTKKELITIVDYGLSYPAIQSDFFPYTSRSYYWSSTTYVNSSNYAWSVDFQRGEVTRLKRELYFYVRCVRDGQ